MTSLVMLYQSNTQSRKKSDRRSSQCPMMMMMMMTMTMLNLICFPCGIDSFLVGLRSIPSRKEAKIWSFGNVVDKLHCGSDTQSVIKCGISVFSSSNDHIVVSSSAEGNSSRKKKKKKKKNNNNQKSDEKETAEGENDSSWLPFLSKEEVEEFQAQMAKEEDSSSFLSSASPGRLFNFFSSDNSTKFPKIIDQNGKAWRSNRELITMENTIRDGLYDELLPLKDVGCDDDGLYIQMNLDLGPGKSMLRNTTAVESKSLVGFKYALDDERWVYHYERLLSFKIRYGHTRVPQNYPSDPSLGEWVSRQRYSQTLKERGEKSTLTDRRIEYLNNIDFEFDVNIGWDDNYEALKDYWSTNGHCRVPIMSSKAPITADDHSDHDDSIITKQRTKSLRYWVHSQRKLRKMELLSNEQIASLDAIHFEWEPYNSNWDSRYAQLQTFHSTHGHCRVPFRYKHDKSLGAWVESQRTQYAAFATSVQATSLQATSLQTASLQAASLQAASLQTASLQTTTPQTTTPQATTPQTTTPQATASLTSNTNSVREQRIAKLNNLGFDWNPKDTLWNIKYEALRQYVKSNHNANVPAKYPPDPSLGIWVSSQRRQYKLLLQQQNNTPPASTTQQTSSLTQDRIHRLNQLNFDWSYNQTTRSDITWEKRYEELKSFHSEHGHCRVPHGLMPTLSNWVRYQRVQFKLSQQPHDNQHKTTSTMTTAMKRKLDTLNFEWNVRQNAWNRRYQQLRAFRSRYGHVKVPRGTEDHRYSKLPSWIAHQRKQYKLRKLSKERVDLLRQIGFFAENAQDGHGASAAFWEDRYRSLQRFKKTYGHCRVPKNYEHDVTLATWVSTQRQQYKKFQQRTRPTATEKLKAQRTKIEKLDQLGFEWNALDAMWNDKLQDLKLFQQEHGHCRVPKRYKPNTSLGGWVDRQRQLYKTLMRRRKEHGESSSSSLTEDRINVLNNLGFEWSIK